MTIILDVYKNIIKYMLFKKTLKTKGFFSEKNLESAVFKKVRVFCVFRVKKIPSLNVYGIGIARRRTVGKIEKTRVVGLPDRFLPVCMGKPTGTGGPDPGKTRVGRRCHLSVAVAFDELHRRDQRQSDRHPVVERGRRAGAPHPDPQPPIPAAGVPDHGV